MDISGKKNISNEKEHKQEPEKSEVENTGNYLRTLRLGKGLSIKDVAEATRISVTNLNAIEDQNYSSLPATTFARGLLQIYANYLGADAESIVAKFMEEREDSSSQKRRSRPKQPRNILTPKNLAEPSHVSSMTMAGILLLIIVVSFTGYCVYTSWNPFSFLMNKNENIQSTMRGVFPDEKPDQPLPSQDEIIIIPEKQSPPEPAPAIQPAMKIEKFFSISPEGTTTESEGPIVEEQADVLGTKYTVTIDFLKDTDIKLTKDDDETLEKEFKAGDVQTWSADSFLTLTFSQADSAEILVNNSALSFPDEQNGVYTLQIPQDIAELQPDE